MHLDVFMFASAAIGVVLALKNDLPVWLRWVAICLLFVAYSLYYTLAPEQVAQDRGSYYDLYLGDNLSRVLKYISFAWEKEDILLSLYFVLLPKGLSAYTFGVVFLLFGLGLYLLFLLLWVRTGLLAFSSVPLVLLTVLFDRLFVDLTLNTTASTISAVFFAYGLFGTLFQLPLLAYVLSYGFHTRMFFLMLLFRPLGAIAHRWRQALWVFLGLAVVVFCLRLSGFVLISQESFADIVGYVHNVLIPSAKSRPNAYARWLLRGLVSGHPLSLSMFVQVVLSFLLPLFFLATQQFFKRGIDKPMSLDVRQETRLRFVLDYVLITGAVFLLMFPDVALVKRLIILPILILPLLLNERALRWLAVVKVLFFCVAFLRFGL